MQSGLLVLDRNGKIVLCNESMEKTVQASDITGQFYWAVIKDTAVFELIRRIQKTKTSESTELNLYGRPYQCNTAYVMKNNEIIIVFHDITGIRNLGKMKRDFVSNVSHELRTPLTAIKGYAETLKGVKGENFDYLQTIKRHTDRLINIVQDLLVLSELEEMELVSEDFERVDVNTVIRQMSQDIRAAGPGKGPVTPPRARKHSPYPGRRLEARTGVYQPH